MGMPDMDSSNAFARINERLTALDRLVRELAAASGTLASATIYKGDLTVTNNGGVILIDPDTGARLLLRRGRMLMWDDYDENPGGFGWLGADPGSGSNYLRIIPPHTTGDGSQNSVTIRGSAPDASGRLWLYTDGVMTLSADDRLYVDAGGIDLLTGGSLRLYELPTTGSAANLRLDTAGGSPTVQYVTSSARYKTDVAEAVIDIDDVMQLQPKTWVDKGSIDRTDPGDIRRDVGFIAEDLDALPSMRQFVDYDDEGRPDAIQYDRLTAATLTLVQHQAERIDTQQTRIDTQQAQIDALSARLDALEAM